jgi:hypothetical protein
VLRGGGLYGYHGYDDGVYFSAAASLLFGRLPYRDFVLLHPPGIMLVLAPFAELGRLTSDRDAMAVARLAWLLLGALNAGLTARLAGVLGRPAALVAGLFAATWYHSAYGERVTLLEPVGNLALLTALLLLQRRGRLPERYAEVLAGVALGLGTCVKIWGVGPLAVIAVAVLVTRGWRAAGRVAAGAAAAGLVVCGPFLLAAPKAMVRMLVLAQGGRESNGYALWQKPAFFLGVPQYLGREHVAAIVVVTLVACAVLAAATRYALRIPTARLWVALLAVNTLMLLASPVFFAHYAEFLTVPLSLVLGAGAAGWLRTRAAAAAPRRLRPVVPVAIGAVLLLMGIGTASQSFGDRYPGDKLAAFLPAQGCVRADDPGALIQLDVLTRDLRRGCEIPVDFTGLTYYRPVRRADGTIVPRGRDQRWQRRARSYLTSGSATVLIRRTGNSFNKATRQQLAALPVLGRVGRYKILGPPR